MKRYNKIQTVFPGNIKEYLNITLKKETAKVIKHCVNEGIFYGIVNVTGDSMTSNDKRSIPDGCAILIYDLEIDLNPPSFYNIIKIPMGVPLGLLLKNNNGDTILVIKTITFLDTVNNTLRLTSYNPSPEYNDRWIRISRIQKVFKVLQIINKKDLNSNK